MNVLKSLLSLSNFILHSLLFSSPFCTETLFLSTDSFCVSKSTSCAFSLDRKKTMNYAQGLKRSVTTLRGGSLGYAEIVAVKVLNGSFDVYVVLTNSTTITSLRGFLFTFVFP